jgi:hypothetical protein
MKLDRKELIAALERVKPALQSSGSILALKHIWLDGKFLYAYNGALGIRIAWPSKLQPCGIPGGVLLGLLESTSAKEVEFDQTTKTQADLKMGRASATIPLMGIDLNPWPFPEKAPAGPVGVRVLVLTKELIEGLKSVAVIKASKPRRVEHYGVILFPAKDAVTLYTTDSLSLAEISVEGKVAKELAKAVLPYGFVDQLVKLPADSKISFTQDFIIAETSTTQVCSNLLDSSGVFDLPELVDKTIYGKGKPVPVPKDLGEAIERALVLAGGDLEKAFLKLSLGKKEFQLSGDLALGMLKEAFPLETAVKESQITVRLEHLKTLFKGAEEFAISPKALLLFGKGESLFLISAHEESR